MPNETTTEDETVTEPTRCPDCGGRYSYQDLVFGHAHVAGSRFQTLTQDDNHSI